MNDETRVLIDNLDTRVNELEVQVADLERQIPEVQAHTVDDAVRQLFRGTPEPTMHEGRLGELRRERDQAQLDLANVRRSYDRLIRARNGLGSQLSDALLKIRDLEVRHSGLQAANRDLNRQLGELSSKYQKVRQDLGNRNMELAKEVDRLRRVILDSSDPLSQRQAQARKINDLLAERVDLKAEVEALKAEVEAFRTARNIASAKLTKIRAALFD